LVPGGVTRAVLEEDWPFIQAWARRNGWTVIMDFAGLTLDVRTTHPDGGAILIRATFDGYPAVPPTWDFLDHESFEPTMDAFPAAGPVNGQPSVFHGNRVVCAQWSRRAYGEGAPHLNWGAEAGWRGITEGTHAENVPEMLAVLKRHLTASPGRMRE
jgi:hypothetical protein